MQVYEVLTSVFVEATSPAEAVQRVEDVVGKASLGFVDAWVTAVPRPVPDADGKVELDAGGD